MKCWAAPFFACSAWKPPSIINSVSYKFIGLWCTGSQLIRKKNPSIFIGALANKNLLYSLGGCKYFHCSSSLLVCSSFFISSFQFVKGCPTLFSFNRFRHLSHCIWALVVISWNSGDSMSPYPISVEFYCFHFAPTLTIM